MWPRAAALAALLLACGCSGGRGGREVFPIGLFNVDDPSLLTRIRKAGFDHVFAAGTAAQADAVAREARRQGLRVVASPNTTLDASKAKRWPLAAWYLQDEPDVNGVSPKRLQETSERVRAWDSRTQTFVVGQGAAAERYGKIADIFMLDWYPVPHLPLDSVADQIDAAFNFLPKGKPLWFVVQAFDWRDDPPRDPNKPIGRFPEQAEIRFMSWLAIVHGAKGLFFFRLNRPNGATLFDFPEFWRAVSLVSRELKDFQPILEGGVPLAVPFASNLEDVEARGWVFRGRRYMVVLNRSGSADRRLPEELMKPGWRELFEPRRDVEGLLKPYQVMVLVHG